MKVIPVGDKAHISPTTSSEAALKTRAVEAFKRASTQASPASDRNAPPPGNEVVQNQNAVGAEELGALRQSPTNEETEPIAEAAAEAPVEEQKPVDPALSRQFAILARQEKALRAKQQAQDQAFKAKEAALTAREAELASKGQFDTSKYVDRQRLKTDTLGVLAEEGLSYDELTQQILNQQPRDPRVEAQLARQAEMIDKLNAKLEAQEKGSVAAQEAQYKTAVETIRTDVKNLVKTDTSFEAIRATNSINDVVELIEKTWAQDGVLLTNEEAAQMVEDHLTEQLTKYSRIDKIQKRLNANASTSQKAASAQTPAAVAPKQQQPMKTLTNANSSTRQLSARERALLAFKGEKF